MQQQARPRRFAANLGLLWTELDLGERIARAAAAGFDELEFHDNCQTYERSKLRDALASAGLPVGGLNTRMQETVGCAAIAELADQAKIDIDAAIELAHDISARAIHVVAGKAAGSDADATYIESLRYALANCGDLTILIEPISSQAIAGYYMHDITHAHQIIEELNDTRIKIMFDCFHIQHSCGDVIEPFRKHADHIGHVQIASFPQRHEPYASELDYAQILPALEKAGYSSTYGCEYRPTAMVEENLSWLDQLR